MTIRTVGEGPLGRAGHAVLAAASGLLVGVVLYALAATARVMLDSEVASGGASGWLVGSVLVFASAFFWVLIGGLVLVLPPVSLVFVVLALRPDLVAVSPRTRVWLGTALGSVLFGALLALGPSGDAIDAGLLGVAVALGVAFGICRLERTHAA